MANNRGMKRVIARRWGLSLFVGLSVVACVGLLLSQAGCQKEASGTKSPAVQEPAPKVTPAQPATVAQTQPAGKVVKTEPTATGKADKPAEKVVKIEPVATGNVNKPAESTPGQAKPPEPQPQGPGAQAVAGTPKIQVEKLLQDFGDIGPDTTHNLRFGFKSTGTAPLKIVKVGACCGSVVRGVKDGQEYVPGESGAVEIEFHGGSYPGPIVRRLTLQTNDPNQSFVNFMIKANVVLRIEHQPQRLSLFLKKENAGCSDITIKSLDGQPFSITSFRSTANTLTAEFNPDQKATEFVLKPKADMEKLRRNTSGQISIDLTHPDCKNLRISYDVLPEFTVTPAQLILPSLKVGEPVQRDIWIINNYRDDFEIESVSSQQGIIKLIESKKVQDTAAGDKSVPASEVGGTRYHLRVEIVPPTTQDNRNVVSDALQIKIKGGQVLTVHLRGWLAQGS
jgi:hypothetical protein